MGEHSKLPWKAIVEKGVRNDNGYIVLAKPKPFHYPGQDDRYRKELKEWHNDLDFIARACNCHDELAAVCERYKERLDSGGLIDKDCTGLYNCLKAAIKKAKGE